jgi:hypothetical protein
VSSLSQFIYFIFIVTQLIDQFGTLHKILPDHQFKLPWIWALSNLWLRPWRYQLNQSPCESMDLTTNDAIRVFDFGCSDRFGEKTLAEVGNFCQTPTHTPPEVAFLETTVNESFISMDL